MDRFILTLDEKKYLGFYTDLDTHNYSTNISTQINYYYLDCEFVITDLGEELAILAIGNPNTKQEYIINVKPKGNVIDWVSCITGLNDNIIWDMNFNELIDFLKSFVNRDDILIGHHLYNDLVKLNWSHSNIIDTCLMFPTPDGPPTYYSLKKLAQMYLKKTIQVSTHSAIEDAQTAYELVKWACVNNFLKTNWTRIGESIILTNVNCIEIIVEALGIDETKLYCIYTRGSRAIGTNKFNSDYDLVVICDKTCGIINGTLTRCANIDVCIYDSDEFKKYIELQYIWALECIYCPKHLIYLEKINYKTIALEYRYNETILSNDYLGRSIGYETGKKLASGKKHYLNKDFHQAKKHIFIAFRFIDYGIQIITYGYIKNLRNSNFLWFGLLGLRTDIDYDTFKNNWYNNYLIISKKLFKLIGKPINPNNNLKLYNHVSFQRNFNPELVIIKFITNKRINEFLNCCPDYNKIYINVVNLYGILEQKIHQIYKEIISKNVIVDRKDFSEALSGYLKYYHKYLYLLYEVKSIDLSQLKFKPNKIYSDIFEKKTKTNLSGSNYKSIPKKEWIEYQNLNSSKVIDWCVFKSDDIRYIGGLDISFDKNDDSKACGFLSVWNCLDNKIVYEDYLICKLDIPYVSGFLGFREIGIYKKLLDRLELSLLKQYYPQVLFVDGCGILHHRGFGSACHIGFELNISTVGIAKTLLYHDGLNEYDIKTQFRSKCKTKGDWVDLIGKTGKLYGVGLKTSNDSINPLYVSIGHKISLDVARELVIKTCLYKNPEPIRNSDSKSKLYL